MSRIVFIFLILQFLFTRGNDGAYFASGNQLIPMYESYISVKKEILSIRRKDKEKLEVDVYYEFFNPHESKNIIVGFEAASPEGDAHGTPVNGKHPYIHDFTITMNEQALPCQVAIVTSHEYYKNGKFVERSLDETLKKIEAENHIDFFYVYHFKANFKKGINIIRHTYSFDISASVDLRYDFKYILTAANRWSNKGIDDFTLKIDMGEYEDFHIQNSFFTNDLEWKIEGVGKKESDKLFDKTTAHFTIRKGKIIFKKLNFQPKGELFLFTNNYIFTSETFDPAKVKLPFPIDLQDMLPTSGNETALKILRNLPYARRGMVFTSPELKKYYESLSWYIPDPAYVPKVTDLTRAEQDWLARLKK